MLGIEFFELEPKGVFDPDREPTNVEELKDAFLAPLPPLPSTKYLGCLVGVRGGGNAEEEQESETLPPSEDDDAPAVGKITSLPVDGSNPSLRMASKLNTFPPSKVAAVHMILINEWIRSTKSLETMSDMPIDAK
jgi:hypothetical protein